MLSSLESELRQPPYLLTDSCYQNANILTEFAHRLITDSEHSCLVYVNLTQSLK